MEEVDVIGNRRFSRDDILGHVRTRQGERYRPKQVERDLQAILSLGVFDAKGTRVTTETGRRRGVVVVFEVVELPLILDVRFEGLPNGIPEAEINRALSDERLKVQKGAVDDVVQMRKARFVISRYLASRGWPDAKVAVQQENVSSMNVLLTFVISLH